MQKGLRDKIVAEKQLALNEKIIGKKLPFNLDAEKAILGSLLIHDDQTASIAEILTPDDFYYKSHKTIFQAILNIVSRQQRVDLVTLQDELEKSNHLEEIGGLIYLLSLQEDIPSVGLVEQHAKIVKEKAILRELINSAAGIIANCYGQNEKEIEAVLDEAEKVIFSIANKRAKHNFVQLNIWLKKTFQHLSDIKSQTKGITGISAGFKKLDEMTCGFQNGDFIVLAARPSMGKTALALSIARHVAAQNVTVGFLSLEMAAEQLTLRLLSCDSGISHHNIRNATINSDEWIELTHVAGRLAQMNLFIDDTAMQSIMDVRTKARKLKAENNLQFLIIDYLQLMHSQKKHENRHQEVSEISRSLKALAKELSIPIIALSQLSRAVDSRVDKRPMLSDLRESGAIEQDADLILFLYRDIVYNPDSENANLAEVIIGKQRNGPTGTVFLNFVRELTKFEDAD
ncbi:replicative DNA helicase [Candidatus Dependentiae bacterium]|nr:replicative DNA helicase [Candidatus Dependentiae bacterium]